MRSHERSKETYEKALWNDPERSSEIHEKIIGYMISEEKISKLFDVLKIKESMEGKEFDKWGYKVKVSEPIEQTWESYRSHGRRIVGFVDITVTFLKDTPTVGWNDDRRDKLLNKIKKEKGISRLSNEETEKYKQEWDEQIKRITFENMEPVKVSLGGHDATVKKYYSSTEQNTLIEVKSSKNFQVSNVIQQLNFYRSFLGYKHNVVVSPKELTTLEKKMFEAENITHLYVNLDHVKKFHENLDKVKELGF